TQPLCSTRSASTTVSAICAPTKVPRTARGRSSRRSTVWPAPRAAATLVVATDTGGRAGRAIPGHPALASAAAGYARAEAEELLGPTRVETAPRLAVGLRSVPADVPGEARVLGDECGELRDRDLVAGPEVHRVGIVVALGRESKPFHTVVHVQELPG